MLCYLESGNSWVGCKKDRNQTQKPELHFFLLYISFSRPLLISIFVFFTPSLSKLFLSNCHVDKCHIMFTMTNSHSMLKWQYNMHVNYIFIFNLISNNLIFNFDLKHNFNFITTIVPLPYIINIKYIIQILQNKNNSIFKIIISFNPLIHPTI